MRTSRYRTTRRKPTKRKTREELEAEEYLYGYLDGKQFGREEREKSIKRFGRVEPAIIQGTSTLDSNYTKGFYKGFNETYK